MGFGRANVARKAQTPFPLRGCNNTLGASAELVRKGSESASGTVALVDRVPRRADDVSAVRSDRCGQFVEGRGESKTVVAGVDASS